MPEISKLAQAFDTAANYDQAARVQKFAAEKLAELLTSLTFSRPRPRRILELGCGTGTLTKALLHLFPAADITAIDLSPAMIERAQLNAPGVRYHVMDAEHPALDDSYDLICSNFCIQWFNNRHAAFRRLMNLLSPGGIIAVTTLAEGSFLEWRTACQETGLPCGFPDYPGLSALNDDWPGWAKGTWTSVPRRDPTESAQNFLRDLKTIGATTPKENSQPLSQTELRRIMRHYDRTAQGMTYQIAFGSAHKPRGFFVTGTDTGIGKTLVSAILTKALNATYWKPFQTGLADEAGDTATVASLAMLPPERIIAPAFGLKAPLSPEAAARLEGIEIAPETLRLPDTTAPLVVEGAGGLMVPLNAKTLLIDWVAQLDLAVVLIARSGLGTINHTLLSLEALRQRKMPVAGVILSGPPNPGNRDAIERFGKVPVLAEIPHLRSVFPESIAEEAAKLEQTLHDYGF